MRFFTATLSAGLLTLVAGCGESTTSLGLAVALPPGSSAALSSALATGGELTLIDGSNTLVIQSAEVVLKKIEFEKADGSSGCDGSAGESEDCEEFEAGPVLVSLPLDGSVSAQIEADVPQGSYKEIEFELHKVGGDSDDAAFLAAHPDAHDVSVRVTGTWNGSSFTYISDLDVEQELEFSPPLEISEDTPTSVTLTVDVASWFKKSGGALVDPASANKGGENEGLVKENIKISFKGFEDEDHDGHDDHGD